MKMNAFLQFLQDSLSSFPYFPGQLKNIYLISLIEKFSFKGANVSTFSLGILSFIPPFFNQNYASVSTESGSFRIKTLGKTLKDSTRSAVKQFFSKTVSSRKNLKLLKSNEITCLTVLRKSKDISSWKNGLLNTFLDRK